MVAQTVYLDSHLSQVEKRSTCDIELVCMGQNFDAECISKNQGTDERDRFKSILDAIKADSGSKTSRQNLQQKCNVQNFINSFVDKAKRVNPVGSGGVLDCRPVIGLDREAFDKDVRDFKQFLFDGEDSSDCHY